ncbi:AAA family ATPase [Candidatus Poribacteria bacterium]|nr:AAA family ATPase [Candidatus Poribacteria bacterium]
MITELSVQNFKSWENTGQLQIAPLTAFFGANSSGKTSIFQTLLMLKQTAEHPPDWNGAIDFGDERSVVNLSSFNEVIHRHKSGLSLDISVSWQLPEKLIIGGGMIPGQALPRPSRSSNRLEISALSFSTTIVAAGNDAAAVDGFGYMSDGYDFFGIVRDSDSQYKIVCPPNHKPQGAFSSFPFRCYGIRDGSAKVPDTPFLSLERAFKDLFSRVHHLSPLRQPPRHYYAYAGEHPKGVGQYGEQAIAALLSGRIQLLSIDEQVLKWLQRLELIDSYRLQADPDGEKDYEFRLKQYKDGSEVRLTDIGLGVFQILPTLALCYYVPEGSILILEQPEAYLHPKAQADLTEVLIDVVKNRNIQIILETHSEYLLSRLQRRIAKGETPASDTALYFCKVNDGTSEIERLDMDASGNIVNLPQDCFGDRKVN